MPMLSKPSAAARWSLMYITIGALTLVWTVVWFVWLRNHHVEQRSWYYACIGFMLTGLALLVIGLAIGRLGRAARQAELPPHQAMPTEARAEVDAASRAPMVAPANPAAPSVGAHGQTVPPGAPMGPAPVVSAPPTGTTGTPPGSPPSRA